MTSIELLATVLFALAGSMILSVTYVPAVMSLVFRKGVQHAEPAFVGFLKRAYHPVVSWALRARVLVLALALIRPLNALALGEETPGARRATGNAPAIAGAGKSSRRSGAQDSGRVKRTPAFGSRRDIGSKPTSSHPCHAPCPDGRRCVEIISRIDRP